MSGYRHERAAARALALRELKYAVEAVEAATRRRDAGVRAALEAGATQAEVAKVLGVSRQAVSKRRNAAWGVVS